MSRIRTLVTTIAIAAVPSGLGAQEPSGPRASQHGTVSQTVNATTISVDYDRPVARGRELFGGIIDFDVVWTPGANRATWVEFSTSVTVMEQAIDAGRYGIWLVPHELEPWELVLVRDWDTHHSFFPRESEAIRIGVPTEPGAHMEALAFYFPTVGPYQTVLRVHWGDTVLPIAITVPR